VKPTLVWDAPTRLFHWLLVTCFAGAWLSTTSDRWLSIHSFLGWLMLGLIAFRLVWGFTGGRYARFASFVVGPLAGLRYLRDLVARRDAAYLGHNPAASLAIIAMLVLGVAVALTGIFTQGSEERQGAAAGLLSIAAAGWLKPAHQVLALLMLLAVAGHLTGVAVGSWRHHENLPLSMVTGSKQAPDGALASRPFHAVAAVMALAVAAFGGWWFFYAWRGPVEAGLGRVHGGPGTPAVAFVGQALADDPLWRQECGSCHLAFHPNLLPARSWSLILAGQGQHFGTDLALDAPTVAALRAFLARNAAENSPTEAAFKINRSIPADATPLRITETPYWVGKHRGIRSTDWQLPLVRIKSNCAACHLDAAAGTFEDAAMRIPRPGRGRGATPAWHRAGRRRHPIRARSPRAFSRARPPDRPSAASGRPGACTSCGRRRSSGAARAPAPRAARRAGPATSRWRCRACPGRSGRWRPALSGAGCGAARAPGRGWWR
jgi:cytochrome b